MVLLVGCGGDEGGSALAPEGGEGEGEASPGGEGSETDGGDGEGEAPCPEGNRSADGECQPSQGLGEGEGESQGEGEVSEEEGPIGTDDGDDHSEDQGQGEGEGEEGGQGEGEDEGGGQGEGEGEGGGGGEGEGEGEGEEVEDPPGPPCPGPGVCDPDVAVVEGRLSALDECRFGLKAPVDWAGGEALVEALVGELGVVGWAEVLQHLNRRTKRAGVTNRTAIPQFAEGYTWNSGDDDVAYWYPQGITGSSDASADELIAGRRLTLVSWYHKDAEGGGAQRGVRVSVVDMGLVGVDRDDYRHLLLVEPFWDGETPDFRAVEIHAGGIAWTGRYMLVADTSHGLRVFDMERVMQVETGEGDRMGRGGDGEYHARGYRYVVPQVGRFDRLEEDEGGCPVRFSFVAMDRSSDPPSVVTGEYHRDDLLGRVVRWDLDPATGLPAVGVAAGAVMPAREAHVSGRTKMQGALAWDGRWYLSCSSQFGRFGRLYRTAAGWDGGWLAWAYGAEDLYLERNLGLLWTAAEHPGTRDVVSVPLDAFD